MNTRGLGVMPWPRLVKKEAGERLQKEAFSDSEHSARFIRDFNSFVPGGSWAKAAVSAEITEFSQED